MDVIGAPVTLDRFVGVPVHVHAPGAVAVHEAAFVAGGSIPTHVHEEAVLSLVLAGAGQDTYGRSRPVATHDLLYTPALAPHGYRFAAPGRWFNIELSAPWLARMLDGVPALPGDTRIFRDAGIAAWVGRIRAEVRQPDGSSRIAIDGALHLLVAELARLPNDTAARRPSWLRRVEEAIEETLAGPISVEALAALAGVHPRHLLRTFRHHHRTTVGGYVRQRRLTRAREEIAGSGRPLAAIALDAGFADQAHFTRAFRASFGETPGRVARERRAP